MSDLTRTAAKTRARYLLAEPTARFYTEAMLNEWCDEAVGDISSRTFCQQVSVAQVCTSGVGTYAFPTTLNATAINTLGVRTVLNSANVSLAFITPDLIGKSSEDQDEMTWTEWGRNVYLSPVPQTSYSLTFLCWTVGTQTGAGTIKLPQPYHHLVPYYMASLGFETKRNFDMAEKMFAKYEAEIQRITQTIHAKDNPALNILKPGLPTQSVNT